MLVRPLVGPQPKHDGQPLVDRHVDFFFAIQVAPAAPRAPADDVAARVDVETIEHAEVDV